MDKKSTKPIGYRHRFYGRYVTVEQLYEFCKYVIRHGGNRSIPSVVWLYRDDIEYKKLRFGYLKKVSSQTYTLVFECIDMENEEKNRAIQANYRRSSFIKKQRGPIFTNIKDLKVKINGQSPSSSSG